MTCRVCGRPLRSVDSVARGTGPVCSGHVGRGERPGSGDQPELFEGLERVSAVKPEPEIFDFDALRGMK